MSLVNEVQYTDETYIPISDLNSLGDEFILSIKKYRQSYKEIIPIDDFAFANLTETPILIKRRFSKNVEIKENINFKSQTNDFILEAAIKIVQKDIELNIDKAKLDKLMNKYDKNEKDLTIITTWIVKNYKKIFKSNQNKKEFWIPELNSNDIKFIKNFNNIKSFYTISDFIDLNKTSYETGRKALEKMAKLNIYEKKKVGKKFIYQPTEKLKEIMKGDNYGN